MVVLCEKIPLVWLLGRLRPLLASVRWVGHVASGCGYAGVTTEAEVGDAFASSIVRTSVGTNHLEWWQQFLQWQERGEAGIGGKRSLAVTRQRVNLQSGVRSVHASDDGK